MTAEFKISNPKMAAMVEAIIILNLEAIIISILLNAKFVIKIDIVNPIPAKQAVPNINRQFKSSGSKPIPILTAKKEKIKMPKGFPINNPKIIPNELFVIKLV